MFHNNKKNLLFFASLLFVILFINNIIVQGRSLHSSVDDEDNYQAGIPLKVMHGGAYGEKEAMDYFQHFKKLYLKRYANDEEHYRRWKIFYDNINYVNQINIMHKESEQQGKPIAQYGITQFMDLTPNEFANVKLMPPTKQKDIKHKPTASKEKYQMEALPESFDWREKGAVTAVKDQASCGSCWAFSTVENIEGAYFLAGNNLTKFSPQQLVDCDNLNCGCFGGFPFVAMQYIEKRGGLTTEAAYPYCIPPLGNCFPCNTNKTYCPSGDYCNRTCGVQNYQLVAKVAGYENVSQNEDEIAAYLVKNGPLSICLNAMWLQFYHSGISDPMMCPPDIDHAVLLVGFGTHTNWFGEKTNYWIVKNSWGEGWGEKGYFRMIRGKDKCGINTMVANAIVNGKK